MSFVVYFMPVSGQIRNDGTSATHCIKRMPAFKASCIGKFRIDDHGDARNGNDNNTWFQQTIHDTPSF